MTEQDSSRPTTISDAKLLPSRFVILVLLSALSVLPVNVISPSLPNIADEFQSDSALISLSVAGYAAMSALVGLVSGAMSDHYGRRPVALVSMTVFILASIGCAVSSSIATFLIFRAIQASIAACFSVALVAMKETSSHREGSSRMGYAAMAWALAPMIGPTFGGTLDQLFGWRSIFAILALIGVAVLLLSVRELKETTSHLDRPAQSYLNSYVPLLSSVRFWSYAVCMAFSSGTLYLFLAGAPLVIGGSSAVLGLYMGMVPAGFICGSYLTGRFSARFTRGTVLIAARALTCAGLLVGLILHSIGLTHGLAFFVPCMFIGIGNGLTLPVANMGAMSVRDDLSGTAAGLSAAISIGSGALVVSIAGVFLNEAATIHTLLSAMLIIAALALLAAIFAAFIETGSIPTRAGIE